MDMMIKQMHFFFFFKFLLNRSVLRCIFTDLGNVLVHLQSACERIFFYEMSKGSILFWRNKQNRSGVAVWGKYK